MQYSHTALPCESSVSTQGCIVYESVMSVANWGLIQLTYCKETAATGKHKLSILHITRGLVSSLLACGVLFSTFTSSNKYSMMLFTRKESSDSLPAEANNNFTKCIQSWDTNTCYTQGRSSVINMPEWVWTPAAAESGSLTNQNKKCCAAIHHILTLKFETDTNSVVFLYYLCTQQP